MNAPPPDDDPGPPPAAHRWRRPAILLAVTLDVIVVAGALLAVANGFSPIVLAFAAILAIAPWASIIDEQERPRRR